MKVFRMSNQSFKKKKKAEDIKLPKRKQMVFESQKKVLDKQLIFS